METNPESDETGLKIKYLVSGRSEATKPGYLTLTLALSTLPNYLKLGIALNLQNKLGL